jgi:hypothetical protein
MNIETYLEQRVDDQLKFYERATNTAKRKYVWIQISLICLAVTACELSCPPQSKHGAGL